jgi:hypothetical protein
LKSTYMEIANPLLCESILNLVRQMPDLLRTDKALFKQIVQKIAPDIPFAEHAAILQASQFIYQPEMYNLLLDELATSKSSEILGRAVAHTLRRQLETRPTGLSPARIARAVQSRLGRRLSRRMFDSHQAAFRAYLASKTCQMLNRDAVFGSSLLYNKS